ncbi:MAG: hypothetical protein LAT81_01725 [Oceanicaulis sp.]|nr:hypothetical protein [Oceanicaulis sp.]
MTQAGCAQAEPRLRVLVTGGAAPVCDDDTLDPDAPYGALAARGSAAS